MRTNSHIWILCLALLFAASAQSPGQGSKKKSKQVHVTVSDGNAWIGVMIQDVSPELAEEHSLKMKEGAFVNEVVDESPADSAGIKEGDVIIAFNGKEVADADDLQDAVKKSDVGKSVPVVVVRDGVKQTITVKVGKHKMEKRVITKTMTIPPEPPMPHMGNIPRPPAPRALAFGWHDGSRSYGMRISTLGKQLAAYFGAPDDKGVLVEDVKKDSKADKAGFKAGDVIVRAGKKTIVNTRDFQNVFGAYDPGEKIAVDVMRKGGKQTLSLEAAEESSEHSFNYRFFGNGDDDEDSDEDSDADVDYNLNLNLDELRDNLGQMRLNLKGLMRDKDIKEKVEREVKRELQKVGEADI